jgi:putative serine protease PepD
MAHMTEDSRGTVDDPPREDDSILPGHQAEQAEDGPARTRATADDIERVDDGPGAPPAQEAAQPGFTPPDSPGQPDKLLISAPPPPAARERPYEPYGQPPPPPPYQEAPPPPPYQEPSQYGQEPGKSGPYGSDVPRGRPGFVPHGQEPGEQGRYGWPPPAAQHHAPPPGRPMPPPVPPGAAPGPGPGGFGGPGGGAPNWAPVPSPPAPSRGGPALGVLAVVALIVALVAGAVGAGVGVMATDSDPGSAGGVDLGGAPGGGAVQQRPPDTVAGIAQRVLPSVVMIRVEAGGQTAGGTGFIVNGGYVVTNNHVVSGARDAGGEIQIVFNDKKTSPATIKGTDAGSDIAVLQPQTTHNLPPLALGDSDQLAVGDPVIAIGSPLGLQGSVTTGIVSSLNRSVPTQSEGADASVIPAIQTDAAINPGNSGGPLVNGKGQVIGINTAIATLGGGLGQQQSGSIGLGFAIPINHGKRIAQELINTGTARRALIGIGLDQNYTGTGARIADQPQNNVEPIVKNGPADKAGLRPGDVITSIDGRPIEDRLDLIAFIRSKAPGDRIKVTYQRSGKETTVEVTLTAA